MASGPINIQLTQLAHTKPQPRVAASPSPGTGQNKPAPDLKSAVNGSLLPQQIQQKTPPPEVPDVRRAIEQIQKFIAASSRDLTFTIHEDTGRTIITVTNSATGEVIRTIPPETVLALAAAIDIRTPNFFDATA